MKAISIKTRKVLWKYNLKIGDTHFYKQPSFLQFHQIWLLTWQTHDDRSYSSFVLSKYCETLFMFAEGTLLQKIFSENTFA